MNLSSVLNRQQRRELDVILKKRKSSVIDSITDETAELWKMAQANLQWLVGKPTKLSSGRKIDFSMFDFLTATADFTPEDMTSDLKMLQKFWVNMYPYVENVIDNLTHYREKFREIYGIEGETLRKYALQNLELQCYQKFMKEELNGLIPEGRLGADNLRQAFKEYHAKFKDDSDKEIAKIKKREEAWMAKQEAKRAKIEQTKKTRAFGAKLGV